MSHITAAVLTGVLSFYVFHSCGSQDFESLRPDQTGAVPGKFVARVAPSFRDSLDKVKSAINGIVPGSDFFARFSGDDSLFSLTSDSKLSDIFSISLPDLGSDSVNQKVFGKLSALGTGGSSFFEKLDTDKYLSFSTYDPSTTDDPDYGKQYYLEMINWQTAVESLTDEQIDAAAPVVVAVLDTGVEADHEDLSDVMWKDPSSGKVTGYDAVDDSETNSPSDPNGHGTHVAGIIGGTGRNGKGIHGIGYIPNSNSESMTEIMAVKVLNSSGAGTSEYMTRGIRWAVQKHLAQQSESGRENQKMILNMSLGGPFETDGYNYPKDGDGNPVFTDDMFEYAATNDVLILVAAGNESCGIGGSCEIYGRNYSKTYYYPCSYENVLCVAASTHQDKLAGFSNRKNSVGITAPGWQIYSTVPSGVNANLYDYYNGTSQATPVTAGAAALVWSMYPDFSAAEIKAILKRSAATVEAITGEISSGNGRVDLEKALSFASDLDASGESPLTEGEVDPASGGKSVDAPVNDGSNPDAPSSNIDGDEGSACAVVSGEKNNPRPAVAHLGLVFLLTLPLLLAATRPRGYS